MGDQVRVQQARQEPHRGGLLCLLLLREHFTTLHGRKYCEEKCTGNLRFECSTCGKKFLMRQRLICHERTHTGERPFTCPLPSCNLAYMSKTNLRTHMKLTHKRDLKDVLKEEGKEFVYAK